MFGRPTRDDWRTMPDEELRTIYRRYEKERRLYGAICVPVLIIAMLAYGIIGWSSFLQAEYVQFRTVSNDGSGILYYIAFFIAGCLINISQYKNLWLILLPVPMISAVVVGLYSYVSIEPIAMELILLVLFFRLASILSDMEYLKSLPSFPFIGYREYGDISVMPRDKQVKQLEQAANGVVSQGYEHIFTDSREELEKPSPEETTDDHFQQHKMWYGER